MGLLNQLKAGTENTKEIRFPGTDKTILLRILSNQDILNSSIATDQLYKGNKIDVAFQNVSDYEAEKTTQQLFRACIDPETKKPIADNITEFRSMITGDERDVLVAAYNDFQREASPAVESMPDAEFDKLVFDLKKKPSETVGTISSFATLRRLTTFLANQLYNSPTGNGSTST